MFPRKFLFKQGGFNSQASALEWDGSQLLFFYGEGVSMPLPPDPTYFLRPTIKQWVRFQKGLHEIGAYNWGKKYVEEGVMDGSHTKIWITFQKRIKCDCYHLEPPNFLQFLNLLDELTNLVISKNHSPEYPL